MTHHHTADTIPLRPLDRAADPTSATAGHSPHLVRYAVYPLVIILTALYLHARITGAPDSPGAVHGWFTGVLVMTLAIIEGLFPLQHRWRMTWRSFLRRDLPYLIIGGLTLGITNAALAWLIFNAPPPIEPALAALPLLPAALLSLLITDGLWYALHRYMHEGRGRIGEWMWSVHAAHHLPGQVYVLMHGVGHPLNAIMVRILLAVPPWLLGVPPEALFIATTITGVQGLFSHFNADIRTGPLSYLLMGTEAHRWHHAVDARGNYAAVLSIWDTLFGTLLHHPGNAPAELGVSAQAGLPPDTHVTRVMLLPFRGTSKPVD